MKRAAAYLRVSTEDQTEYSPAAQLRELRDYAAAHDLLLEEAHIYADEGISGRSAQKRPAFLRMISDARSPAHPFDVILVHKFDRFARSREDSIVYKSMLRRAGVEVISIKEPLSEGNYSGVMEAIYESFAEAYSVNLGQEVRKGMTEKALRGQVQTAPPFGYRLMEHHFVPHAQEAPLVQELFRRYAAGEGFSALAQSLNQRGIRTRHGKLFENRTVEYILRNPVYIGKLSWNPTGRTGRHFDDPHRILADGGHEPLISPALWDAVQQRIALQKLLHPHRSRPAHTRRHWLSGLVRCAACGSPLVWVKPHFLRCGGYARGKCTQSQHIAVEYLEEALLSRLEEDLQLPEQPAYRLLAADDHSAALRARLHRLTEAYMAGALELSEFQSRKAALLSQLPSPMPSTVDRTLHTLRSPNHSIAEKYEAVNAIVDRCIFDKASQTLTVVYRIVL